MNKHRAWKTRAQLEAERKMDERIKAMGVRERAFQEALVKMAKERKR